MTFEEEVSKLKETVDIVDVINNFTPLHKHGKLYNGLCIFHNDTNIGSFKVDEDKKTYKCYACGSNGDVIDFLTNTGKTFNEAVEILKHDISIYGTVKRSLRPKVDIADFAYIKSHEDISFEKFVHSKFGIPENVYTYRDEKGLVIGYVLRYLDEEGKKQILPYNWCTCIKSGWEYQSKGKGKGRYYKFGDIVSRFIGFGDIKPLYGLDKLAAYPNAKVLVVEGEKCADFIQALYNPEKVISICWQSGTNTVDRVDWSSLNGRDVYLIPDNDRGQTDVKTGELKPYYEQPSPKAFKYIRDLISGKTNSLYWVKPFRIADYPDGWDLADTNWDGEKIFRYIQKHKTKYDHKH